MPTRSIKNCRDSRLFKGFSPIQLLYNRTENRPHSATFHTAGRYDMRENSVGAHRKFNERIFIQTQLQSIY